MNIITQKRVAKLNDPDITRREYNEIIKDIGERVDFIWRTLLKISKRNLTWYAFQNDVYDGGGDGSSGGCFDPETDGEFIELIGEFDWQPEDVFARGFPTRFLWTENEVWTKEVKDYVVKRNEELHRKKMDEYSKIIASIKKKLTTEELKYVKFITQGK